LTDQSPAAAGRNVELERTFDAPRELVFSAFTDPDQVPDWWGPDGFHTPRDKVEIEPRVGGRYHVVMVQSDSGAEFPTHYEIVEIVEPELLVLRAPAMPEFGIPDETTTRVELHDEDGRTRMTLTSGPHTGDMLGAAEAGWRAQLEKLARLLSAS
jgi:uncharacterized protein YndB with AHSA1/START domain